MKEKEAEIDENNATHYKSIVSLTFDVEKNAQLVKEKDKEIDSINSTH